MGVKTTVITICIMVAGITYAEIPADLMRRLSKMTLDEYLNFVGTSQPESDNSTGVQGQQLSSSGRIRPNPKDDIRRKIAQADRCAPHLITVAIPQNPENNIFRFPPCILLERCSGCEDGRGVEICAPVNVTIVPVAVSKAIFINRYPTSMGVELIPMEKHLRCESVCKVKPTDCRIGVHVGYSDDTCQCICEDQSAESSCPSHKQWDNSICQCKCSSVTNCDSRWQAFNTDTCRCEQRVLSSGSDLPSSANDPTGSLDTRGLDDSVVERLRAIVDGDTPTTTAEPQTTTTTEPPTTTTTEPPTTTTTEPPTTTTTEPPTTTTMEALDCECDPYWEPVILQNGLCGCRPQFDLFSGGKR